MTANSLTSRTNTTETYKGFYWKYQKPADLPDEIWKDVPIADVKLRVSSAGRVEFQNTRRTYGTVVGDSEYRVVEHGQKSYPVHFLVCAAFHEHPTSLDDKSFTPDHKNHQVDDNRADNLQWASKREQVLSRRCMKLIVAVDTKLKAEKGTYETINDARAAFGVGRNTVIQSLNGKTKVCRALPDIRFEWRKKVIEHVLCSQPVEGLNICQDSSHP